MDITTLDDKKLALIKDIFLFEGTDTDFVNSILRSPQCQTANYNKGAVIFSPENFERCIAVVLDGSILVSKKNNRRRLIMSELNRGDIFGAATLFNEYKYYTAVLTAKTPVCILFFSESLVRNLLRENLQAAENYLYYLSRRIRFLSSKIDLLSAGGASKKLYEWLCERAENNQITLNLSLSDLADTLSIGRASLYRAFDELTEGGLIVREGKIIKLV